MGVCIYFLSFWFPLTNLKPVMELRLIIISYHNVILMRSMFTIDRRGAGGPKFVL